MTISESDDFQKMCKEMKPSMRKRYSDKTINMSYYGVVSLGPKSPIATANQDTVIKEVLRNISRTFTELGFPSVSNVPSMTTRKLKTKWTPELAQDLASMHAISTQTFAEMVGFEFDKEIKSLLKELSESNKKS